MKTKDLIITAADLILCISKHEKRTWLNTAEQAFWSWVDEQGSDSLRLTALASVSDYRYLLCERWMLGTETGRLFLERAGDEERADAIQRKRA